MDVASKKFLNRRRDEYADPRRRALCNMMPEILSTLIAVCTAPYTDSYEMKVDGSFVWNCSSTNGDRIVAAGNFLKDAVYGNTSIIEVIAIETTPARPWWKVGSDPKPLLKEFKFPPIFAVPDDAYQL